MSSISFMKQLISWIPNQFRQLTDLLSAMVNMNQLKLILVSLYILFGCTITLTLMLNQYQFLFSNILFVLCRTYGMFMDGFVANQRTIYLVSETYQDIVNQAGLTTVLLSIVVVRTYNKFLLFNIILVASLEHLTRGEK